ncbi:hypothetical protein GUJ93_ZPchr0009g1536 [Zizania palustris]|uniref:Uncharacterized protein n=1 Tax=Zizania palustris TaxID=103762 RepID=A0A8J5V9B2_ZIZPA|nr:hypothetical protein GUJ93_ZPchr0009g1536 [Zizania palustris]
MATVRGSLGNSQGGCFQKLDAMAYLDFSLDGAGAGTLEGDAFTNTLSTQEVAEAWEEAHVEVADVLELDEEVGLEDASGELLSVPRLNLGWRLNMYMEASPYRLCS